jgi:hypothetical protein
VRPRAFTVAEAIGMLRTVRWASERIAPLVSFELPGSRARQNALVTGGVEEASRTVRGGDVSTGGEPGRNTVENPRKGGRARGLVVEGTRPAA